MTEEELYHFGIKGMKWGVRRYQNKDGSYTPEGKKRADAYRRSYELHNNVRKESHRLIESDARLKKDFGDGTDDPEYLALVAKEYGINTKRLDSALSEEYKFNKNNRDLIKQGKKMVDADEKKFLTNVNDPRKWTRSMNNASDKFNAKLKDINDRYKDDTFDDDFSTKRGQQYVKEVNALWKGIYADQLINDFGPEPINNGKEWVEHMPFMDQYAQWIKD